MAKKNKSYLIAHGVVAENRKARHQYSIEDSFEAGIILMGSEVKSLRAGRVSMNECYAGIKNDRIYLFNLHIPILINANKFAQYEPKRPKELLLHKRQIHKIMGALQQQGYSLIPLRAYFNDRGILKILLGLAKGKKQTDKRETIKQRDWDRRAHRLLKN